MADLFQDPEFQAIRRINDEIFAVEQLCRQYGFDDVRQALFRVRVYEGVGRETFIRGRVKRENEAAKDGVKAVEKPCGAVCRAGQQDGIACADDECDRENGTRPAGVGGTFNDEEKKHG